MNGAQIISRAVSWWLSLMAFLGQQEPFQSQRAILISIKKAKLPTPSIMFMNVGYVSASYLTFWIIEMNLWLGGQFLWPQDVSLELEKTLCSSVGVFAELLPA